MKYGTYDSVWVLGEHNQHDIASVDLALEVAAGDTTFTWVVYQPCRILRFGYFVSVAFNYDTQTTEGVVALDKRVTYGSDTGRVEVCRLDLEDGLSLGDVRDIVPPTTNADCEPGDELVVEVVTQAVGGTEVGDWVPFVTLAPRAEVHGNITSWTLSAYAQVV